MKQKICKSCGGPVKDYPGKKVINPDFCPYCVDAQGELKSYKDIVDLMIEYLKDDHKEIPAKKRLDTAQKWLGETEVWRKRYKDIDKILKKKGEVVLATSDIRGILHICVMSYVRPQKSILLMTCESKSRKVKNIRQNKIVTLSKYEVRTKPSLLMYGQARILGKKVIKSAMNTILKIAPEYKAFVNEKRTFIEVRLTKVIYEWYYTPRGKGEIYFELEPY